MCKCDIPASWLLPENRVSCREQGAAPEGSLPPVDQAGEPTARRLVRCVRPTGIPPRWHRWLCRRFLHAACGTWFPASMHRKGPARRAAALPLRTALTQRWQGKSRSGISVSKLKDPSNQTRFSLQILDLNCVLKNFLIVIRKKYIKLYTSMFSKYVMPCNIPE